MGNRKLRKRVGEMMKALGYGRRFQDPGLKTSRLGGAFYGSELRQLLLLTEPALYNIAGGYNEKINIWAKPANRVYARGRKTILKKTVVGKYKRVKWEKTYKYRQLRKSVLDVMDIIPDVSLYSLFSYGPVKTRDEIEDMLRARNSNSQEDNWNAWGNVIRAGGHVHDENGFLLPEWE